MDEGWLRFRLAHQIVIAVHPLVSQARATSLLKFLLHYFHNFHQIRWMLDESGRTALYRFFSCRTTGVGGGYVNDRNVPRHLIAFEAPADIEAQHVRQIDVQNHQAGA